MAYQSGPASRSNVSVAARLSPAARQRPSRQERSRQVRDRAAHRLGEVLSGRTILLLLERPHTDHQPRDTIVAVELDQPIAEPAGLINVALTEDRKKSAAEQISIARISFENIEVVSRRCAGIALDTGVPRRQIASGGRRVGDLLWRRCLGGERRWQAQQDSGASDGGVPGQQRINHDSSMNNLGRQTGNQAVAPQPPRENDLFAMPSQGRHVVRPEGRRNHGKRQWLSSTQGESARAPRDDHIFG